ncbi:ROK family protein [Breznakiella homolactica]|uniref:ROK family protein n=1 Tax=Breznakiella homolactica TaxID=2798577 RepID=A0A7T7XKZ6_9SPIR|nr:ROK family transcriptional regulator [Breznakiella homolactica]QQO08340.1 ROK family protein [Breznakiella homolactica]
MKRYIASDLKDMNRRTVYNLIASVREISRAEISRRTGISSPTVIKIIDHFISLGIVTMEGEGVSKIGRKPQIIRFNEDAAFSVGIEFDSRYLYIGIANLQGNIVTIKRFANKPNILFMLKKHLVKCINSVINQSGIDRSRILGIGIGIPGSVDPQSKIITLAPSYGVTDRLDVSKVVDNLEKDLDIPVIIERDVYAAAIGEFMHRKSQDDMDLIFIFMGSGVGAGIILDGRLRRGGAHMAGEIGYISFDISKKIDPSSLGWLESKISKAIADSGGDTQKTAAVIADNLAIAIAAVSISLDIEQVILGGPTAELLGEGLLKAVNRRLPALCLRETKVSASSCEHPAISGLALMVTEGKINELLEGTE